MDPALQSKYMSILGIERQQPTLEYLRALIHRHLHRIPFENMGKFHYYLHRSRTGLRWLPPLEDFLDNYEKKGLGGNCYILNLHFGQLLQSLGFEVAHVCATGGNSHLANQVTVEGRAYYVDVGYGAPLFEPIRLEEEPRFNRCGEEVEIIRVNDRQYVIDRRVNGQSFVVKTIEWHPVPLQAFEEPISHSLRDEDENPFMRRIVATMFKNNTAYSVANQKLLIKADGHTEVHEFPRRSDWLSMMGDHFGFRSDVLKEALSFIEARGVFLFKEG